MIESMEDNTNEYKEYIEKLDLYELQSIMNGIDATRYPNRYKIILKRIRKVEKNSELKLELENKFKITNKYKTSVRRYLSYLIDGWILTIGFNILLKILFKSDNKFTTIVLFIFSCLFFCIYTVFYHSLFGQTIGKMVCKVKIVDISENNHLSIKQALMRDSILIITSIILILIPISNYFMTNNSSILSLNYLKFYILTSSAAWAIWIWIELISMEFGKNKRSIQDKLAKTVVLRIFD